MGFNVERMRNEFDTPNLTGGSFNFGTLANFLRNVPSRFGALYPTSDTTRDMSETLVGGYIQDDLRLANTLTAQPRPPLRDDDHPDRGQRRGRPAEGPDRSGGDGRRQDPRQQPDASQRRAARRLCLGSVRHAQDGDPRRRRRLRRAAVPLSLRDAAEPVDAALPPGQLDQPAGRHLPVGRLSVAQRPEPAHRLGRPQPAARLSHAVEHRRAAPVRRLDRAMSATSAPAAPTCRWSNAT